MGMRRDWLPLRFAVAGVADADGDNREAGAGHGDSHREGGPASGDLALLQTKVARNGSQQSSCDKQETASPLEECFHARVCHGSIVQEAQSPTRANGPGPKASLNG